MADVRRRTGEALTMIKHRWFGHGVAWTALAVFGGLLVGCAEQRPPAGPSGRVFAADLQGGARMCEANKPDLVDGKTADVQMRVGNDGGWCAVSVQKGSGPYDSGLLTARPVHGKVLVHKVGDTTRITYTPNRGYAGPDAFSVKLIPGDPTIRVVVTVQAP